MPLKVISQIVRSFKALPLHIESGRFARMKSLKVFFNFLIFSFSLVYSFESRADFGEIDILVRESIEIHFKDYGRTVDLQKLKYTSEPKQRGNQLLVRTSVWAEQGLIHPYWGWYDCTTKIEVTAPGKYTDLGSECFFEFD